MALYKTSQVNYVSDEVKDFASSIEELPAHDGDEVILYEEMPSSHDVVEMHRPDDDKSIEITFKLPSLPGAPEDCIEVSDDDPKEVKEEKLEDVSDENEDSVSLDPWDRKSIPVSKYVEWLHNLLKHIPKHSGSEVLGLERTISFLEKVLSDTSKAVQEDYKGEIDISKLEEARNEILDGVERLKARKKQLEKKREKKSSDNFEIVKEAAQPRINGIMVSVPSLISTIARICINSSVSAGKDLSRTAVSLIKRYKLDDREELQLLAHLKDMGYEIPRPRAAELDEDFDPKSSDNYDLMANYPA